MLDSIGLSGFLVNFGLIAGLTCFVVATLVSTFLYKRKITKSIFVGLCFALLGFISSPLVFYVYLRALGYTFLG